MIIDHHFFGRDFLGNIWDTAIPTTQLDEVKVGSGVYDELFVTVDKNCPNDGLKPVTWDIKTIMDAKFKDNLEAGWLQADGHVVTDIHIYRRNYEEQSDWLLMGQFPYDQDYNMYSFVDRFCENGIYYSFCVRENPRF